MRLLSWEVRLQAARGGVRGNGGREGRAPIREHKRQSGVEPPFDCAQDEPHSKKLQWPLAAEAASSSSAA
jgi:hypothetical protein